MKVGVIYPQNELQGDPDAVGGIGLAAEKLEDHLGYIDRIAEAMDKAGLLEGG